MKRFILTGTPGSGKTAILRQLEVDGFGVVEEAATDVIALWQANGIAEPWMRESFIDAVLELQRLRELRASSDGANIQFHDRSVICTATLSKYLGYPASKLLLDELERVRTQAVFQPTVFFVRNLGFVEPTEARRISYEESLRFEAMHEAVYREHGYELVFIEAGRLADRVTAIKVAVRT
jgi:predicted ATPase